MTKKNVELNLQALLNVIISDLITMLKYECKVKKIKQSL